MAAAEMVRVENRRPSFLELPQVELEVGGHKAMVLVRLKPGGNDVPRAYIDACEKLDSSKGPGKIFADWKKKGLFRVLTPEESATEVGKPEGPKPPEDLRGYKTEGALELVALETDVEVLRRWSRDRRREVKAAIAERITTLTKSDEPEGEEPTEA